MSQIAFILLCHKDPQGIIDKAERLTAAGDYVAIHFDGRASDTDYARIRSALDENPHVAFAPRRVKCGWGEWSLVKATLLALETAVEAFPRATHFYMISGDCMAIKSAEYAHAFLDAEDVDYIESFDFFESDWIKTGLKEERLIYRHFFNERENKWLFYRSLELQKALGLSRRIPEDLEMRIGSQWWCLRRNTVEAILDFCRQRRDVLRFFSTTWIPDETFFQTLVPHLVPRAEIRTRTLTFLMFTDYGMPVTFYNDHYDLLLSQDYLFARKISPHAHELKRRLGELYNATGVHFQISNEGTRLFKFLTQRGRVGRRFAPRFWESEASLGRDRQLLIVACKKWHVAKRLIDRIREVAGLPVIGYLFNEQDTPLPDLGGIQTTIEKRHRHRRALMRMLFDYYDTKRLVICLDPASIDLMRDFYSDRGETRLLEVQCSFSDEYLIGHAKRVGLMGENAPRETAELILPTIRRSVAEESEAIRDEGFPHLYVMRDGWEPQLNARPLAQFLDLSEDRAREIAETDYLFAD
ncbi:Core-2/I-Branching enzyme [Meinhardsimonia xiamenensis]|jgi:hypothetical protein|uniref:Peptide O-xylosyltransferase n=1 Tax=Meinhardsimonia xiamenensis TaxID=990712 RepID=A0A1G8XUK9_9RHOB|nr:DUF5928 domain-containing protein [Meinhardsimonia xiamenensis]PRX37029.1 core-2/I-Branching enzyme [Meinhardsimonia xiamenensis]SDJ93575.1 Core-2/I-Branching enzyme [Meinhardsimonia xiamenensis]